MFARVLILNSSMQHWHDLANLNSFRKLTSIFDEPVSVSINEFSIALLIFGFALAIAQVDDNPLPIPA